MVVLGSRAGITLAVFEEVAWRGEPVLVEASALQAADVARDAFLRLSSRPDVTIYGVTSRMATEPQQPDIAGRRHQARAAALRAVSFGEPLPERVARGIALARLANFLGGHAAVSARLIEAVASLLDNGRVVPSVPAQGNGGSGEILALGHLFGPRDRIGRPGREGRTRADQRFTVRGRPRRRCSRCGRAAPDARL